MAILEFLATVLELAGTGVGLYSGLLALSRRRGAPTSGDSGRSDDTAAPAADPAASRRDADGEPD
ncbi:hypothetical protein GT755_37700 [Herbidospora sp. NEAU-GS84]|uniref:Uncharacterized protein n=1 Tax=Herbidospora solisilvae TaxID=2696284 RepID=A0A7C9N2H2_9ACTN|nr:hypothetical protein [Herbidospora solisilvae]NAS27391.1 hypothetical protein [Herbidospora solisilvae]